MEVTEVRSSSVKGVSSLTDRFPIRENLGGGTTAEQSNKLLQR